VTQAAQTITFANPGLQLVGTPITLSASASSGLVVSLSSTTTSVCTVSGTTLTPLTAGTCSITASQGGDANVAPATSVIQSFAVGVNLVANGGFESTPAIYVAGTQPGPGAAGAGYWLTNSTYPVTVDSDAHTGSSAALLTCPQQCASNLFGNSSENGGLTLNALNIGTSPTLTFWVKGSPGTTGNLNYDLRYLSSGGAILGQSAIVTDTNTYANWTQLSISAGQIPVGTAAVFLEVNFAIGPVGTQPSGQVFTGGSFRIDDIRLVGVR
jgi:hypothetical protein